MEASSPFDVASKDETLHFGQVLGTYSYLNARLARINNGSGDGKGDRAGSVRFDIDADVARDMRALEEKYSRAPHPLSTPSGRTPKLPPRRGFEVAPHVNDVLSGLTSAKQELKWLRRRVQNIGRSRETQNEQNWESKPREGRKRLDTTPDTAVSAMMALLAQEERKSPEQSVQSVPPDVALHALDRQHLKYLQTLDFRKIEYHMVLLSEFASAFSAAADEQRDGMENQALLRQRLYRMLKTLENDKQEYAATRHPGDELEAQKQLKMDMSKLRDICETIVDEDANSTKLSKRVAEIQSVKNELASVIACSYAAIRARVDLMTCDSADSKSARDAASVLRRARNNLKMAEASFQECVSKSNIGAAEMETKAKRVAQALERSASQEERRQIVQNALETYILSDASGRQELGSLISLVDAMSGETSAFSPKPALSSPRPNRQGEIDALASEIQNLKLQCVALKEEKEKFKVGENALRTEVKLLEKQLESLRAASFEREQKLRVQSQASHSYEQSLEKAHHEVAAAKSELARATASAQERIQHLEAQLQNELRQRMETEAKSEQKKSSARELQTKLRMQRATSAGLREEMKESERRTDHYKSRIALSLEQQTSLQSELQSRMKELESKREEHSHVLEELEHRSRELDKSKIAVENLRDSLRDKSRELRSKEDELHSLAMEMTEKTHQMEESKRVVAKTRRQVSTVQKHLEGSTHALKNAEAMHVKLLDEMRKMYGTDDSMGGDETVATLERELGEARRAMGIVEEVSAELRTSTETLKSAEESLGVSSDSIASEENASSSGDALTQSLRSKYEKLLHHIKIKSDEADRARLAQLQQLEDDVKERDNQIEQLRGDLVKHAQDLLDAKADAEHAKKSNSQSQDAFGERIKVLESALGSLSESAEAARASHDAFSNAIRDHVDDLNAIVSSGSSAASGHTSAHEMQQCVEEAAASLEKEEESFAEDAAAVNFALRAFKDEIDRLNASNGSGELDMTSSLSSRVAMLAGKLSDMRTKHAAELRSVEMRLSSLSKRPERDNLKEELNTLRTKMEAAQEEAGQLRNANEDLLSRLEERDGELEESAATISDAKAEAEHFHTRNSDLEHALSGLQSKYGALQQCLELQKEKSAELEAEMNEAVKREESAVFETIALKRNLAEHQAGAESTESHAQAEVAQIRMMLDEAKRSAKAAQREQWKAERESRIAYKTLEAQLVAAQADAKQYQKDNAKLEKRLGRLVYDTQNADKNDERCNFLRDELARLQKEKSCMFVDGAAKDISDPKIRAKLSELNHCIGKIDSELVLRASLDSMEAMLRSQMIEAARDAVASEKEEVNEADAVLSAAAARKDASEAKQLKKKVERVLALHEDRMNDMRQQLADAVKVESGSRKVENLETELAAAKRTEERLCQEIEALQKRIADAAEKSSKPAATLQKSKRSSLERERKLRNDIAKIEDIKAVTAIIADQLARPSSPEPEKAMSPKVSRSRRYTVASAKDVARPPVKLPFQKLTSRRRLSTATRIPAEMRVAELEAQVKAMRMKIRELESHGALTEMIKRRGAADKNAFKRELSMKEIEVKHAEGMLTKLQTEVELLRQEKLQIERDRGIVKDERQRHKKAELDLMMKHQAHIREIEAKHEKDLQRMRMRLDDYKEGGLQAQSELNQLKARNREMSMQLDHVRARAQTVSALPDKDSGTMTDLVKDFKIVKAYSSRDMSETLFGTEHPKEHAAEGASGSKKKLRKMNRSEDMSSNKSLLKNTMPYRRKTSVDTREKASRRRPSGLLSATLLKDLGAECAENDVKGLEWVNSKNDEDLEYAFADIFRKGTDSDGLVSVKLIEFLRFKQRLDMKSKDDGGLALKFVCECMHSIGLVKLFGLIDAGASGTIEEIEFIDFFVEEAKRKLRLADMNALKQSVQERIETLEAAEKDLKKEQSKEEAASSLNAASSQKIKTFQSKRRRTAASLKIVGSELIALRTQLAEANNVIEEDSKNDPKVLANHISDAKSLAAQPKRALSIVAEDKHAEGQKESKPAKKAAAAGKKTSSTKSSKFMEKAKKKVSRSIFSRGKAGGMSKSIFSRPRSTGKTTKPPTKAEVVSRPAAVSAPPKLKHPQLTRPRVSSRRAPSPRNISARKTRKPPGPPSGSPPPPPPPVNLTLGTEEMMKAAAEAAAALGFTDDEEDDDDSSDGSFPTGSRQMLSPSIQEIVNIYEQRGSLMGLPRE